MEFPSDNISVLRTDAIEIGEKYHSAAVIFAALAARTAGNCMRHDSFLLLKIFLLLRRN